MPSNRSFELSLFVGPPNQLCQDIALPGEPAASLVNAREMYWLLNSSLWDYSGNIERA